MLKKEENKLIYYSEDELLIIEAYSKDAIRVRSFVDQRYVERDNALNKTKDKIKAQVRIENNVGEIVNGKIRVVFDHRKRLTFYNHKNEIILKEYIRLRAVKHDDGSEDISNISITKDFNSTLKLKAREYNAQCGGASFNTKTRFEAYEDERIYGMGQYQHQFLNQKYNVLELAQRNTQVSIPFYLSNKNYGFLWNNPGIGKVTFAKNLTEWEMFGTNYIDYWVNVGDNLKEITRNFTDVVGRMPMIDKKYLGLWQSKLRYRTPKELYDVLEGYKARNIQLSTIAIDYFHWPKQGEYRFDPKFFPKPAEMIDKIKNHYQVEPIISIWPTVSSDAANYQEYVDNGYLIKVNKGIKISMQIQGNTMFIDTTNPNTIQYVWKLIDQNYKQIGVNNFWIDVAEPGFAVYDYDNYRYYAGTALEVGNLYPNEYLKMIYEGLKKDNSSIITLVRGSWLGAQKYGALLWSGDIDCSFRSFRNQINTGLNVGLAGVGLWTTDIGGFHGGNAKDIEFRELLIRWFQYATFSPILRMHGDRLPHTKTDIGDHKAYMATGAANEIWSYGLKVEKILTKYLEIRELLKDYLYELIKEANQFGYPIMRPLFYEFESDENSWCDENSYMLGSDILVSPITEYRHRYKNIYLPKDSDWLNIFNNKVYRGGKTYQIPASLETIPVFIKSESKQKFEKLLSFTSNI